MFPTAQIKSSTISFCDSDNTASGPESRSLNSLADHIEIPKISEEGEVEVEQGANNENGSPKKKNVKNTTSSFKMGI